MAHHASGFNEEVSDAKLGRVFREQLVHLTRDIAVGAWAAPRHPVAFGRCDLILWCRCQHHGPTSSTLPAPTASNERALGPFQNDRAKCNRSVSFDASGVSAIGAAGSSGPCRPSGHSSLPKYRDSLCGTQIHLTRLIEAAQSATEPRRGGAEPVPGRRVQWNPDTKAEWLIHCLLQHVPTIVH